MRASERARRVTIDGKGRAPIMAWMSTLQRPCQFVRQKGPIADRSFAIEFLDPAAEPFAFALG